MPGKRYSSFPGWTQEKVGLMGISAEAFHVPLGMEQSVYQFIFERASSVEQSKAALSDGPYTFDQDAWVAKEQAVFGDNHPWRISIRIDAQTGAVVGTILVEYPPITTYDESCFFLWGPLQRNCRSVKLFPQHERRHCFHEKIDDTTDDDCAACVRKHGWLRRNTVGSDLSVCRGAAWLYPGGIDAEPNGGNRGRRTCVQSEAQRSRPSHQRISHRRAGCPKATLSV